MWLFQHRFPARACIRLVVLGVAALSSSCSTARGPVGSLAIDASAPNTVVSSISPEPSDAPQPPAASTTQDRDAAMGERMAPQPVAAMSPVFVCDRTKRAPERALTRLSRMQYLTRIRELIELTALEHSPAILNELEYVLAALPRDLRSGPEPDYGGLRRLDQSIYAEAVDGTYAVAVALGAALTSSTARLHAVAGGCAVDDDLENDAACVDAFIQKLGKQVFRRPLTAADLSFYRELAQDSAVSAADYAEIVTVLVSSPFFLYAVELGDAGALPVGTVALTAQELAARLALHFWQSAPDDELLHADLLDAKVYAQQLERVYADAKTERMLEELFVDWLEPKHLEELHLRVGSFDYDALRGDFTPAPELKSRMLRELGRMGVYYAHRTQSSFAELFQSRSSFAETADLAEIYGVPVWSGNDDPPQFPDAEREGLLTRAALVATGHGSSHPIFKGVYARRTVLCETIPPPPADANTIAKSVMPEKVTSRAVTEALSAARADCAACHATLINPIGYTLEHFDGLGRFRSLEQVFDATTGVLLAEEPVDSKAVPHVVPDDKREARGAADLHRFMLESGRPQACFVRRYFRYSFAREEDDARDGCVLDALLQPLLAGESLGSVLRAVALQPEFRSRSYEP